MLCQRHPRDQTFLQPGCWQISHPGFLEGKIIPTRKIKIIDINIATHRTHQPRQHAQEQSLTGPFHAGKTDDLSTLYFEVNVLKTKSIILQPDTI
jgi:hypothetical protein